MTMLQQLTQETLLEGIHALSERDFDLAGIVNRLGLPPLWAREPGFSTLVYIILEQQVSLASARAAFNRLCDGVSPLTPGSFLMQDDATLRRFGFSRQKTTYSRHLAQAILDRTLDIDALSCMEDEIVRHELKKIKGIGDWTANIYLLMALLRPDVWPHGDRALAVAVQRVKKLDHTPDQNDLINIGAVYRPWRSVAARLFWLYYLNGKDEIPDETC